MATILFYPLLLGLFIIQLFLCIKCSNKYIKVFPLFLLVLGIIICIVIYFTTSKNYIFLGNDFAAFVTGLLLCIALIVDVVAWICYLVYKYMKIKRTN